VTLDAITHEVESITWLTHDRDDHHLDMWAFHTMRHLLCGVLDASRISQVNASWT
jgi:hypothetical protein